jgi:hypothetical protein
MKSVIVDEQCRWPAVDGKLIDANFAEMEGRLVALDKRGYPEMCERASKYRFTQADIDAALKADRERGEAWVRAWWDDVDHVIYKKYEPLVSPETGEVKSNPPMTSWNLGQHILGGADQSVDANEKAGTEAEKPRSTVCGEDYYDAEERFTQADIDKAVSAALKADRERFEGWTRRWWSSEGCGLDDRIWHILNGDPVPKRKEA